VTALLGTASISTRICFITILYGTALQSARPGGLHARLCHTQVSQRTVSGSITWTLHDMSEAAARHVGTWSCQS